LSAGRQALPMRSRVLFSPLRCSLRSSSLHRTRLPPNSCIVGGIFIILTCAGLSISGSA
jgi:hypothetical protein